MHEKSQFAFSALAAGPAPPRRWLAVSTRQGTNAPLGTARLKLLVLGQNVGRQHLQAAHLSCLSASPSISHLCSRTAQRRRQGTDPVSQFQKVLVLGRSPVLAERKHFQKAPPAAAGCYFPPLKVAVCLQTALSTDPALLRWETYPEGIN